MCDRIAIIDKGNLVALDTTQKLLDRINTKKINLKLKILIRIKYLKWNGLNLRLNSNQLISVNYDKNLINFSEIIDFFNKNTCRNT